MTVVLSKSKQCKVQSQILCDILYYNTLVVFTYSMGEYIVCPVVSESKAGVAQQAQ